jgi:hypothetical protein
LFELRAFGNRGGGYGWQWEYVIEFDPITINDAPGWGGRLRRGLNALDRLVESLKPERSGPLHPYEDFYECGRLDSKLQERYRELGYTPGQRLTDEQARELLNDLWRRFPEMRRLYPSPNAMIDRATELGRDNWFYKMNEIVWGPPGEETVSP